MSETQATAPVKKNAFTKRNIAIGVVVFVILMVIGGNAGTRNKTVTVEVQYVGKWSGALGNGFSTSSWSGDGNYVKTLTAPDSGTWIVSANAQKQEDSSWTLTLSIKDSNGKILAQDSTTAAYGMVQIGATIP